MTKFDIERRYITRVRLKFSTKHTNSPKRKKYGKAEFRENRHSHECLRYAFAHRYPCDRKFLLWFWLRIFYNNHNCYCRRIVFLGILIRSLGLLETSISTIVASLIAVPCATVIGLGLFIAELSLDIVVWFISFPVDVLKEGVIDAFKIIDLISSFFNEVLFTDTAKFVYYCLSLFLCNLFIGILSNTKQ